MALHILAAHQNVVGWQLVLNYMQTLPTHYFLESSRRVAYMKLILSSARVSHSIFDVQAIVLSMCMGMWESSYTLLCTTIHMVRKELKSV